MTARWGVTADGLTANTVRKPMGKRPVRAGRASAHRAPVPDRCRHQSLRTEAQRNRGGEPGGEPQIAEATGFASARTLSRTYKRHYGRTPAETRRGKDSP